MKDSILYSPTTSGCAILSSGTSLHYSLNFMGFVANIHCSGSISQTLSAVSCLKVQGETSEYSETNYWQITLFNDHCWNCSIYHVKE
jgi:hypothetical protein